MSGNTNSATDVVVVGGGLAGAALAIALAGAGHRIILLERKREPCDKVCGEFISREAALYLEALGVDLLALGAEPITAVRVCAGDRQATVDLPFPALSLSRRTLDEALLERAAREGVEFRRGCRVRALEPDNDGWHAQVEGSEGVTAGTAFLATGKHDLRGWKRPATAQSHLIAFKLHWRLRPRQAAALSTHVELTLFPGGYAGLQPVERNRANLCLVVDKQVHAAHGGRWDRLLGAIAESCPMFGDRLAGAEPCREAPLAVAALPYGHLHRSSAGPWRLGDQAAVIPPFTGDGMSIALHSARLAAACFLRGENAGRYHDRLRRDVRRSIGLATLLSRALVGRQSLQPLLPLAARRLPGLITGLAAATRIPPAALRRAGLVAPG